MLQGEGKALKRGLFVVFEGLDRSGKSTQSAKLAKYLKEEMQIPVKAINFPSKPTSPLSNFSDRESVSGKTLNQYLQNKDFKYPDEAVHLMFSANRWEMKEQILSDLREGITLICDRYAFSGVAYSAAKVILPHSQNPTSGTRLRMVQEPGQGPGEAGPNFLH